jgi:thymidylate kinase
LRRAVSSIGSLAGDQLQMIATCGVAEAPLPLEATLQLFRRFDEAGVSYCHFKSNANLLRGLAGETDLDILADRRQARAIELTLLESDLRRFRSTFAAGYPAVEDYIGFDPGKGRLIHVHLHYRLVLGEKHLKNYQLDLAETLLRSRVADLATGIYKSDPHHELYLLLIRAALKIRWRDFAMELCGKPFVRGHLQQEFAWLLSQTEVSEVDSITSHELGPHAAACVSDILSGGPSIWRLRALRSRAAENLSWHCRIGPISAPIARLARELYGIAGALNRCLMHRPMPFRRTSHTGGFSVAFLGTHGAGKSTVANEIRQWLAWKLDVHFVYFGSGAGPSSLLRWPMKALLRFRRGARTAYPADGPQDRGRRASVRERPREAAWLGWARAAWALALALEKRSKLKSCLRARSRGMIVVCDRYPQVQTLGYNDGPLLGAWLESRSRLRRHLARTEYRVYERAARLAPDLVIRLDVPPEVAARRRPAESLEELQRRREVVREVRYGENCRFCEIDASKPLDEVLLAVKRAIWRQLAGEVGAPAWPVTPGIATVASGSRPDAVTHDGFFPSS